MNRPLPWLEPGEPFPSPALAWAAGDPVPGLLAAGGRLDAETLLRAYGSGIFPWFSEGQPPLWWSTDPRMVLEPARFRLHRSLRKAIKAFASDGACEIRIDTDFSAVIRACASTARDGQDGTWIVPKMIDAYMELHTQGHAHSVETWVDGELTGGLYCVNIGRAVFGESMFARRTDASKLALAALVAICRRHAVGTIDCQQNTAHLASLGAAEIPRSDFLARVEVARAQSPPSWAFETVYWNDVLSHPERSL